MKHLFVICFILLTPIAILSQSKEDLEKWVYSVENNFPEIDKNIGKSKLRSGSPKYNKIRYNLLSDRYFKPVFEQSFQNLSSSKKSKIQKRISKYKKKGNAWAERLSWYMWGVFSQSRAYENAKKEVSSLNKLRVDYNNDIGIINSLSTNYRKLVRIKNEILYKYKKLLPSEIENIETKTIERKTYVATTELINRSKDFSTYDNSFSSVNKLEYFTTRNNDIYVDASTNARNEINGLIKSKKESIVNTLAKNEQQKLLDIDFNSKNISSINDLWKTLNNNFNGYKYLAEVNNLYHLYGTKKTEYINNNIYSIAQIADKTESIKKLDDLQNTYLFKTNSSVESKKLEQYISKRKDVIKKRIEKRKELFLRRELQRKTLIEETKNTVLKNRSQLKLKYESNFPTLDQLFEIKNLGSLIGKQSYKTDQTKLINYLSRIGYALKHEKLFSDHNTFINHKGYRIETWRLEKDDGDMAILSSFIVEDVPTDILHTYIQDITSQGRKRFSSQITPWEIGEEIKEKSDFYVKSGTTLYRYKYKEGKLEVSAWDNLDASSDVVAEKIDENKYKITPWTNLTNIKLEVGEQVQINASGSITLGAFAGSSYPVGISGFRAYNVLNSCNHGSLIGKIGKGDWFYIGSSKTITAKTKGYLRLRINDDREVDNSGYFTVNINKI